MTKKQKSGFSLIEAMIVMVVMAVAIVAMTPSITKKVVNNSDFGTTLTGNSHGRYEVFMKEIFDMGQLGLYEKTIDETKNDGIVLYERKTNPEIYQLSGGYSAVQYRITSSSSEIAALADPMYKLYEEFRDVTPHRDSSGRITHVTFLRGEVKDNNGNIVRQASNTPETVAVGGRYIIENQNVVYRRGSFRTRNGVDTWVLDSELKDNEKKECYTDLVDANGTSYCTDPLSKNWRIIEGQATSEYGKLANRKEDPERNNFFEIYGDCTGNITVTNRSIYIPWERLYDGNKLVLDRQIPLLGEKAIAFFNPTSIVKNATIHAVGGGGAGGGIDESTLGRPIFLRYEKKDENGNTISLHTLKETDIEYQQIKNDLMIRFVELAAVDRFGKNYKDKPELQSQVAQFKNSLLNSGKLVKYANISDLYTRPHENIFGPHSDDISKNTYIVLNVADGTINVKMDRRPGGIEITPDRLLQYTHKLGTSTQMAEKWNMPKWDIIPKGNTIPWGSTGKKFDYIVKVQKDNQGVTTHTCYNANANTWQVNQCPAELPGVNLTGSNLAAGEVAWYNHIYTWSIPYAVNSLKYGTAGEPGVYATKVVSLIKDRIAIELGEGGKWDSLSLASGTTRRAPSGSDTVIKTCTPSEKNKNNCNFNSLNEYQEKFTDKLFSASGGKGGLSNLSTDMYDLCWTNHSFGVCEGVNESLEKCCHSGGGRAFGANINATSARTSLFENIRALAGMSKAVGIGAGRGAQGMHSISGDDVLYGTRVLINSSNDGTVSARRINYKTNSPTTQPVYPEGYVPTRYDKYYQNSKGLYENYVSFPRYSYYMGSGGAVVITW